MTAQAAETWDDPGNLFTDFGHHFGPRGPRRLDVIIADLIANALRHGWVSR